jgi:hypothetical protein
MEGKSRNKYSELEALKRKREGVNFGSHLSTESEREMMEAQN